MRHLLTHTSGFETSDIGDATWDAAAVQQPREFLRTHRVTQSFPPGTFWLYSNTNFVIVGHLIERSSGLSLGEYMLRNIFDPLGMTRSSLLQPLLPEVGRGVFVATNMRSLFPRIVISRFLEHFHPGVNPAAPAGTGGRSDVSQLEGQYRSVALPRGTLEKFGGFLSRRFYLDLRVRPHGIVELDGEAEFVEVEPGLLQRSDGKDFLAYGSRDGALHLFWGTAAFRKLAWYETRTFHWWVFRSSVILLLLSAATIPIERWRRRVGGKRTARIRDPQWIAWVTSVWLLLFLLGMIVVTETHESGSLFDHGVPFALSLLLAMPLVGAVLELLLLVIAAARFRGSRASFTFASLQCGAVAVAAGVFIWWAWFWNLLGWWY